ncbi:MAG: (2Fe-2S)-binding protein [Alphaproteobacteria bacterium]|nr:(2Fe-2S)-binding protein [Alphaproteobacteria bacterium]
MTARHDIFLTVNGCEHHLFVEPRRLLCDVIREDLGLTGTHVSCELGVCGICSVLMDGKPVSSCLMFAVQADGACIETVESLNRSEGLHPLQQAFHDHHGLQCGFCTPGFLVTLLGLLREKPNASNEEIEDALDGVLCRCTGYQNIRTAARAARDAMNTETTRETG